MASALINYVHGLYYEHGLWAAVLALLGLWGCSCAVLLLHFNNVVDAIVEKTGSKYFWFLFFTIGSFTWPIFLGTYYLFQLPGVWGLIKWEFTHKPGGHRFRGVIKVGTDVIALYWASAALVTIYVSVFVYLTRHVV